MSASGLYPTQLFGASVSTRAAFAVLRKIRHGSLTVTLPDGEAQVFTGPEPGVHADLFVKDWKVVAQLLRSAEIGMAECYRDGSLGTSDLTRLLTFFVENRAPLERVFYGNPLVAWYYRMQHWMRSNSKPQAKRNIAAHYDLSNDFYRLWLDPSMTYSSAIFAGDTQRPLAAAQRAKYLRILEQLNPRPGDHILEIGCGWGGFAELAAREYGVRITGITLSQAQWDFATARIAAAGLSGQVELRLQDYRDVEGQFDHIVSIEMFEAVGEQYWPQYFRTVRDRLKPGGQAVIQTITLAEDAFARYRVTSDFIREYIFPGGMLAPVSRVVAEAGAAGLSADKPYHFGLDYAETLLRWREAVHAKHDEIRALGFDEAFLRLWHFYLCYCEAGFRTARTSVMQIGLKRAG